MARLTESILEAALADGLIKGQLSDNQKKYLHTSVLTANKLLSIIGRREDANIEQIAYAARLDRNTCLIYCRWLQSKGLIKIIPYQGKSKDGRRLTSLYYRGEIS